ncbi:MAG: hypothetical protein AAF513_17935 [Pseudomonadota bacterium]
MSALIPGELPFAADVPLAVQQAYRGAQVFCTERALAQAVDRLAVRLTLSYQDANPFVLVRLPEAAVFAGMLQQRMVTPLRVGYLSADVQVDEATVDAATVLLLVGRAEESAAALMAGDAAVVAMVADDAAEVADCALRADRTVTLLGSGLDYLGYGTNLPGLYQISQDRV